MDEHAELQRRLLEHVARPNYRPVKPRAIAKQLKLAESDYSNLRRVVKKLVREGRLIYGSKHLVKPAVSEKSSQRTPSGSPNTVTGTFRRASAGYGFVRPSGTAASVGKGNDIFIAARKTLDAANGDVVIVRASHRRRDGQQRTSGEIVEVLERQTHQFVGTYFDRGGAGYVQIDGRIFTGAISVGDAGAKDAANGDKVVVEMVRFPSSFAEGEGVIVEVLGRRGAVGVDTMTIMREFNLPERFPEAVLEAARKQADKFDESVGRGRMDLTDLTVVTIDPKSARDFDDAISLERIENDHWRLGVHIADVSHFVRPRSALDREARHRATSVYLPDRVVPMLPEIVSNNLASLQPDRIRYTKSAFIEFSPDGVPIATQVCNTSIKSKRRFTYEEIDQFLAHARPWKKKLTPEVFELLGRMHELAMMLRRRRMEAGAIELTLPEVKIDLDKDGRVSGAHLIQNTESHQIIEEFMLAANVAVAQWLHDRKLAFLRRVHEAPDPKKLALLTDFVRELGIECESLQSRFEIKRVIAAVEQRPERHAVNYAVLRSMQKAVYRPIEEGHYALGCSEYCHFTSPIRRYPDLTIHRLIDALAKGKKPAGTIDDLEVLGEHCSEREQRAEKAERELIKLKLLNFLSKQIGNQMDAVITGVEEFGLFAMGTKLPAEGLIHVSSLQDDYYDYDAGTHTLCGKRAGNRYRLGDVIRVEVFHVDIDRRELDFRVVSRLSRPPKTKRPGGEKIPLKSAISKSPKAKKRSKRPKKTKRATRKRKR